MKEIIGTDIINPIQTQQIFAGTKNSGFSTKANFSYGLHNNNNTTELFSCTRPVHELIKDQVNESEDGDAFFVCDIGQIVRQHLKWKSNLPRVEPFYAIKCNTDINVLKTMVLMGNGFDCASKGEMETMLKLGVSPSKIVYANPCKQISHIRFAAQNNIEMMTFDNADELYKIKKFHPSAKMILRVLTDDSHSLCKFGIKFGASPSVSRELLEIAKNLGVDVIGVSFHVGSGCFDSSSFHDAVLVARQVFDIGQELGFDFTLLDVGGGFPGSDNEDISFIEVANVLGSAIDQYFPKKVRVIAEPGRYYVASAFTLSSQVIARRVVKRDVNDNSVTASNDDHPSFLYYINDGIYASFNCLMFDHQHAHPKLLCKNNQFYFDEDIPNEIEFQCSVWGPTCDSLDCLTKNCHLPEMNVGDWMYFNEMGAYTICAASEFNGFKRSKILYTNTETRALRHIILTKNE